MSIDGTFGISVVFHDRSGERIKVLQMADHQQYSTGKVAFITGTAGTAGTSIAVFPQSSYKDSTGNFVTFEYVTRAAFSASGNGAKFGRDDEGWLVSKNNEVSVASFFQGDESRSVVALSGTVSFQLILFGS